MRKRKMRSSSSPNQPPSYSASGTTGSESTFLMPSRNNPLIIGICGGSGSGKTYLLELLTTQLEQEVCLLSQDHYYFPLELQQKDERNQVNFDLPSAIDQQRFLKDLDAISLVKETQLTESPFNNPARAPPNKSLKTQLNNIPYLP